jgi:hypothetical protein
MAKLRPIAAPAASCGALLADPSVTRITNPPSTEPMMVNTQKKVAILPSPLVGQPVADRVDAFS